jgi:hypothetical protein
LVADEGFNPQIHFPADSQPDASRHCHPEEQIAGGKNE